MEKKIDGIATDIAEIKKQVVINTVTLAVNTESLQHHMRRTELLEARADKQDARIDSNPQKIIILMSLISGLALLGKTLLG